MRRNTELVEAVIKLHSIASLIDNLVGAHDLAHAIRDCADKLDYILEEHHDIQQDKGTEGPGP